MPRSPSTALHTCVTLAPAQNWPDFVALPAAAQMGMREVYPRRVREHFEDMRDRQGQVWLLSISATLALSLSLSLPLSLSRSVSFSLCISAPLSLCLSVSLPLSLSAFCLVLDFF